MYYLAVLVTLAAVVVAMVFYQTYSFDLRYTFDKAENKYIKKPAMSFND